MKKALIVFPTAWDAKQLEACAAAWRTDYEIVYGEPDDVSCPWDFDVAAYLERTAREWTGRIDGVLSSSDYPGATAAGALASRLGLPGSPPETVIRCSHKYYSRLAQREAAPEAVPWFQLIDPRNPGAALPGLQFPCFVKPVKGAFSVFARRVEDAAELEAFLSRPAIREFTDHFLHIFNRLARELARLEIDGRYFIAEELLRGELTTVEGFVHEGGVELLGIVDSVTHPETGSFVRFDYPSSLPQDLQERAADVARRVIGAVGLSDTLFNIEMVVDRATGRVAIIEINPRLCGQFADLYQKVDGTNGYEVALALATGSPPPVRRGAGACGAASSFPLRIFESARVQRAPGPDAVRAIEARHPGALVWIECEPGQALTDFESVEDGASYRYAVVNVGGRDRDDLMRRFERIRGELDIRFAPIAG